MEAKGGLESAKIQRKKTGKKLTVLADYLKKNQCSEKLAVL